MMNNNTNTYKNSDNKTLRDIAQGHYRNLRNKMGLYSELDDYTASLDFLWSELYYNIKNNDVNDEKKYIEEFIMETKPFYEVLKNITEKIPNVSRNAKFVESNTADKINQMKLRKNGGSFLPSIFKKREPEPTPKDIVNNSHSVYNRRSFDISHAPAQFIVDDGKIYGNYRKKPGEVLKLDNDNNSDYISNRLPPIKTAYAKQNGIMNPTLKKPSPNQPWIKPEVYKLREQRLYQGGSFIGVGTYGCVTKPPVKCDSNSSRSTNPKYKKTIGKIFENHREAKYEKEIFDKVKSVDPFNEWTVQLVGSCYVNKFNRSDEKEKCPHVTNEPNKYYTQLIYNYGGKDLHSLVKMAYQQKWSAGRKRGLFIKLCTALKPVLYGLGKLSMYDYQHLDLKPANILYDEKQLRVVDFGLMDDADKIYTHRNLFMLQHDYLYYPPEFKLYALSQQTIDINKHYAAFARNFSFLSELLNNNLRNQYIEFFKYIRQSNKSFRTRPLNRIFSDNSRKVDVYSLGMTFIELHHKLVEKDTELTFAFKQLFEWMISINCVERPSWSMVIQKYNQIV
jgi:hypothetical protein